MTPSVRLTKVDPGMFEEIYRSLLRDMDPERPREEWRRIFEPGWSREEGHCGYALRAEEGIVGFLGLIFARREVDGTSERLCNVTTWVVREEYRAAGSWLLFPLREMDDYTITNLTPDPATFAAFSRFGFEVLETHLRTFLPPVLPGFGRRRRGRVLLDPREVAAHLERPELTLFRDHRRCARHALLVDDEGYCYCIYTIDRRNGLRRANLHYVSDRKRLAEYLPALQRRLFRVEGLGLVECDSRFAHGVDGLPWSYRKRIDTPELYRSTRLSREEVTALYSELLLLNLRV